jgi:hypothetical protein
MPRPAVLAGYSVLCRDLHNTVTHNTVTSNVDKAHSKKTHPNRALSELVLPTGSSALILKIALSLYLL